MIEKEQSQEWEVVVASAYDAGDPTDGAEERVLARAGEAEARRVFSDTAATAAESNYAYVKLRSAGREVESWPQATGWTS
jgi:hypothetical protein